MIQRLWNQKLTVLFSAKDFENKLTYFDEFSLEQANIVCKAINRVNNNRNNPISILDKTVEELDENGIEHSLNNITENNNNMYNNFFKTNRDKIYKDIINTLKGLVRIIFAEELYMDSTKSILA